MTTTATRIPTTTLPNPVAAHDRPVREGRDDPGGRDPHDDRDGHDGRVAWHVDELASLLTDRGRLAGMDADAIQARIGHLRRLAGLADAALATAVAALDRVGGVAADGAATKAEWLKAHTGRSGRDAARMERLANALDDLPATARALADGRRSAEAADAVVGAARDGRLGDPMRVEDALLPVATDRSPEQWRRHIRLRQQRADGGSLWRDERRQQARRGVSLGRDANGMWDLHARLTGEVGDKFATMLDAFDQPVDRTLPGPDQPRPDQRRHDALERAVDAVLDGGRVPGTGGITRAHLSVIVPAETLGIDLSRGPDGPAGTAATADSSDAAVAWDDPVWAGLGPGETAFGGLLSPQAVRRLACDASISRIVMTASSQVLDVGRATRNWSGPQRRAVNARDRGCRGPNCSRPIAWTQVHHVQWWRRDGVTAVDNGLALCHHCHHLVHDRGWTVELDAGTATATWIRPDGLVVATRPRAGPASAPSPGDRSPTPTPSSDPDPPCLDLAGTAHQRHR